MPRIVFPLNTVRDWWHRILGESRKTPQPLLRLLAVGLLAAISVGAMSLGVSANGGKGAAVEAAGLTTDVAQRNTDVASRSENRATSQSGSQSGSQSSSDTSNAKAAPSTKASAPASPAPKAVSTAPVAGLSTTQMANAKTIIAVGEQMQLPKRAYIVALATAMQESKLANLANWNSAESLAIPHEGTGGDWDSVGLFQQRPSSGWGTIQELMTPAVSARRFYQALAHVPDWANLPITVAAQSVQGSAFPDAYADDEPVATAVVDALAP
jgi:hypothetical protein